MRRKPLPNALDIDLRGGLTDAVTPHAGAALLIEAIRRSGVPAAAERHLPAKRSPRGLGQGAMVETFVLLSALGGDCLDDLDELRRDMGLAALAGYTLPAASTARQWLDRFHEPELLEGRPAQGSFIPMESAGLAGLRAVLVAAIRAFVSTVPVADAVTLDVDAHLVESSKSTALPTYEGFRGFQPALVSWAETGLVLAEQFRDGNVPASAGLDALVDEAYAALPSDRAWWVSVRSDSAAYDGRVLDHWAGRGWRFAVSADMSPQLRAEVVGLPNDAWAELAVSDDGFVREWAEVAYVPTRRYEQRDAVPYRYLAVRVRPPQGEPLRGRRAGAPLRARDQRPGDRWGRPRHLAPGQGGHGRARPSDAQGRAGGRDLSLRQAWRERRLAAAPGAHPRPAGAVEGRGPRCRPAPCPSEATPLPGVHAVRPGRPPRPHELHPGRGRRPRRPAPAGAASARPRDLATGGLTLARPAHQSPSDRAAPCVTAVARPATMTGGVHGPTRANPGTR